MDDAFFCVPGRDDDSLLLEKPEKALILSREGILLAERIRPEQCPSGNEVGKRSLLVWAHAVHGSSLRALERYTESAASFQRALGFAASKVLPWASAEVWRRYAALLLSQGSMAGFEFVNRALTTYVGFPASQADALVLRGLFQLYLEKDHSAAALDFSQALELVEAKRNLREEETWSSAVHNLSLVYSRGSSDLPSLEAALRRLRCTAEGLSRHEPYRRNLCLWVEALLLVPLGLVRRSCQLLGRAIRWFKKHGHAHQAALCTVDLALIHLQEGELELGRSLLGELPEMLAGLEGPLLALREVEDVMAAAGTYEPSGLAALREALALFASRSR